MSRSRSPRRPHALPGRPLLGAVLAGAVSLALASPALAVGGHRAAADATVVTAGAVPVVNTHGRTGGSGLHITGRGHGHGHGLSQWGAQGAALRGLSARQILAFYYPTLRRGSAHGTISVLMSHDTGALVVSDVPGLRVTGLADHRSHRLHHAGATQWRLAPADEGRRTAVSYRAAGGWHQVRSVRGEAQFDAGGAPLRLHTPDGTVAYRGVLRSAAPQASKPQKRVSVNVVPLEAYLRGVVPTEAYPSWRPAALQAQAVAARTYAVHERAHPLSRAYQICDTSACQNYGGASAEVGTTDRAVAATRAQVLTWHGKPAFTQYSASNGGWMAAGSEPYLVAKKDPYDKADPYRSWTADVGADAIEKAFPAIGSFQSAAVPGDGRDGHGTWGGRVQTVAITGSAGTVEVSGDTFAAAFGLWSTWFTLG